MSSTAPSPARLFVPVHAGPHAAVLRTFTDPLGHRTGVAFTSREALRAVLGDGHPHLEIGRRALRALLRAAGVEELRVDPRLVAAPPADRGPVPPGPAARRARPRVEGFAAISAGRPAPGRR
ncbi:SAV_915 family protein [Kineococcus aurantiacus]|uniref:SseB protein N-terminal domain-containing protein n=1 Tax=Kineococcus aurantiacus TaxID=37633 RepID=A0A7Y9J0H6_9ACTN|nr:SAV_915 family protein [Kineococcus aurantiacus]NYD22327.1 hypothetical protein [Kineococcus aurantiacus]